MKIEKKICLICFYCHKINSEYRFTYMEFKVFILPVYAVPLVVDHSEIIAASWAQ